MRGESCIRVVLTTPKRQDGKVVGEQESRPGQRICRDSQSTLDLLQPSASDFLSVVPRPSCGCFNFSRTRITNSAVCQEVAANQTLHNSHATTQPCAYLLHGFWEAFYACYIASNSILRQLTILVDEKTSGNGKFCLAISCTFRKWTFGKRRRY